MHVVYMWESESQLNPYYDAIPLSLDWNVTIKTIPFLTSFHWGIKYQNENIAFLTEGHANM